MSLLKDSESEPYAQIVVNVSLSGISIFPENVEVLVDGIVEWSISIAPDMPPIYIDIYFSEETLFFWNNIEILVVRDNEKVKPYRLFAAADKPGDYKYGVRTTTINNLNC